MNPGLPGAADSTSSPDAPAAERRAGPADRVTDVGVLLALPLAAYWLMHFMPMAQNGYLDPFIYTGYIHNFQELLQRYGVTYYSVRFGLILPGQLAATTFGPIGGYFLLRYLLALAAVAPFFFLLRQRFGRALAFALSAVLVTSPYLARTVLWDHPDAFAVPFLFGSICLFMIEHRRSRLLGAGAGAFGGMAVHSNFFAIAPLAIYVGCYALLWLVWRRGVRPLAERLAFMAIGFIAITAAGSAYYWWLIDQWDIFSITLAITFWLAEGGTAGWRTEDAAWVTQSWSVLTPIVLSASVFAARISRRLEFHDAALWVGATATTLFFYAHQFLLNGNSLELFYYFSYALPAILILLALNLAAVWTRNGTLILPRAAVVTFIASATVPWVLYSFEVKALYPASFGQHMAVVAVGTALVVFAARSTLRPARALIASAALGMVFFSCFARPVYASLVNSRLLSAHAELDVYRVALQFMRAVPAWDRAPGHIRFWYGSERPRSSIDSIQSTFLWGYSRVHGTGRGMPELGPTEIELLTAPDLRWVGLLAESRDELERGRSALRNNGIEHRLLRQTALSSGSYTVYFELLDLKR